MWPPGIQCQLCPMTFSNESAISAHYDTAHAPSNTRAPPPPRPEHPDARHPCNVCGRNFTLKQNLRKHMRTVHKIGDVKTFRCDVCFKSFTQKGSLKLHLSTVHGLGDVSGFSCNQCSYVAGQKGNLKRHLAKVHRQ